MGFKLGKLLKQINIAVGVGRVIFGGQHEKIFSKIEQGEQIAEQAKIIADMVKQLTESKPK